MLRRGILAVGALAIAVLVLVAAQLVLPGIAAQRLRDRLSRSGRVLQVQVDAFPAIELLWHEADRVVIRMASYSSSSGVLQRQLGQLGDAGDLDASAAVFRSGLLTLRNASLRKRGRQITGQGTVTEADLRSALPVLNGVSLLGSGGGTLVLRGSATLLGVTATVDATVRPQAGTLVVSPDVPFGGLATITVFSSPVLAVRSIAAAPVPGGFVASATAALR